MEQLKKKLASHLQKELNKQLFLYLQHKHVVLFIITTLVIALR